MRVAPTRVSKGQLFRLPRMTILSIAMCGLCCAFVESAVLIFLGSFVFQIWWRTFQLCPPWQIGAAFCVLYVLHLGALYLPQISFFLSSVFTYIFSKLGSLKPYCALLHSLLFSLAPLCPICLNFACMLFQSLVFSCWYFMAYNI